MRRLFIIVQILIFTAQAAGADASSIQSKPDTVTVEKPIVQEIPKNYRLPDMILLDSIAFYNRYRDQHGKRIEVQGFTGRFASTFGEEFRRKIYELEKASDTKIEFILTLSSTKEDAKIYRDKLMAAGRKAMIVEIPDEIQKEFLERADAQAAGGLKELWWDTKDKAGKLIHLDKTIRDTKARIRDQFVKPNRADMDLAYLSLKVTGATAVGLLFVGVDPSLVVMMAIARAAIGGTTLAYHRTISNIFKTNVTQDLSMASFGRRTLLRLLTMTFGFAEAYYAIGTHIAGANYGITQGQILSNTITSGVIETAAAEERNNRLSQIATTRMIRYTIMLGAALSTFSMTGTVGPVFEAGIFEISTLQGVSLAIFGASFFIYKYQSDAVEKFAQQGFFATIRDRANRLEKLRRAREERIVKERQDAIIRRMQLAEILEQTRSNVRTRRAAINSFMCVSLFR